MRRKKADTISYHIFPKDPDLLTKWIDFCDQPTRVVTIPGEQFCREKLWTPATSSKMCGRHFGRRGEFVLRAKPARKAEKPVNKIGSTLLERVFRAYVNKEKLAPMETPADQHERISKTDKPDKGEMWTRFVPRFQQADEN